MEAACLRHTDIPRTSRLFSDFQYHFDRVTQFYDYWPGDIDSYARAAERIQFPEERRAALVAALRTRNGDSPSLDLLAKPGTVAVITGQQVGLFSGPAYTIYKALTAVKLARELTARGLAAVPVFWLATEDHDLAEVNHCYVFGEGHQPEKLEARGAGAPGQPVGTIPFGDAPVTALRAILESFPFGAEVAQIVERAYRPGGNFGGAFEDLLKELLAKWDLLFVDPLDHALREIAAPILRQALLQAPELSQSVLERNRALTAAGYHAQVHVENQTSFFFLLDGERRITLKRQQDGEYASKDRRYTIAELAAHAAQLSPNALLRPVIQDYLLPTVAYIGGPAELAYLAQSQPMYHRLLNRMPVVLARNGFTLLDARSRKLMNRYGLNLQCFFGGQDCLREKIAAKLVPPALISEFESLENSTAAALDRLKSDVMAFDPTLAAALEKSRSKILYQIGKLHRKTARESLRRDERASAEARFLTGLIFPEQHLQERFYSILPFLAKHGLELLDTLYDAVSLDCPDHKILVV